MQNSLVIGIAIGAFVLLALFFIAWLSMRDQQRKFLDELDFLRHQLGENTDLLQHSLSNQQQTVKRAIGKLELQLQQLEREHNSLAQSHQAVSGNVRELAESDPEVKMYQRAKQMIAAGADLVEVTETCGLPQAEVELLFSIHQNK